MSDNSVIVQLKQIRELMKATPQMLGSVQYYDWLFAHGEQFAGRHLLALEEDELSEILGKKLYKPRMCFYNAQLIVTIAWRGGKGHDFDYYEGYAQNDAIGLNFEHGWLVRDGKVFDPTWRNGIDYFGVHVPAEFVAKKMLRSGEANSLLIDYFMESQVTPDLEAGNCQDSGRSLKMTESKR